ncbi:hypothetical protein WA158_005798, partial [Blastocystis sp. Blastoise]
MAEIQNQTICKYSTFNQEDTMDNHPPTLITNPERFYEFMFNNYLDKKAYRRLWFDFDCCRHTNDFSDLTDENIHKLIERVSELFIKIYNPNDMNILTTKKTVNRKIKVNDTVYSWGMHVFTNWFIKTDLLTY